MQIRLKIDALYMQHRCNLVAIELQLRCQRRQLCPDDSATSLQEAKNIWADIEEATTILLWKNIKRVNTEGRNQFTEPGWLPKPGTAYLGRLGRQSSSEEVTRTFWMENQNGTNQPCTECSKRWSRARGCPSVCVSGWGNRVWNFFLFGTGTSS